MQHTEHFILSYFLCNATLYKHCITDLVLHRGLIQELCIAQSKI